MTAPSSFPPSSVILAKAGIQHPLELIEGQNGFTLKPKPIDLSKLGGLRDKIAPGTPAFDIRKFRDEGYNPAS